MWDAKQAGTPALLDRLNHSGVDSLAGSQTYKQTNRLSTTCHQAADMLNRENIWLQSYR